MSKKDETKVDDTKTDNNNTESKIDESLIKKLKESATEYIKWESNSKFKDPVSKALKSNDLTTLQNMFEYRIAFGTAGLRAKMSGGYAYMNDLVIIQTAQGLCAYAEKNIKNAKKRGIIIGYDGRYNSKEWSEITLAVFLANGWRVYWFNRYAATPMVPYGMLLDKYKCAVGVVVTASHNPKEDNGFKVYWENGAQIIPPQDAGIAKSILNNLKPKFSSDEYLKKYNIKDKQFKDVSIDCTEYVVNSYMNDIKQYCYNSKNNKSNKLKVVYTPMHGVGAYFVELAYKSFNLTDGFVKVDKQYEPDPEFSTVKFPNPEEGADSLELSIKTADSKNCQLILANDPDADRLAVAEKINNKWFLYNGNQMAILLSYYLYNNYLKNNPKCDKSKLCMVASTVSSKYLQSMAKIEGFQFRDTLTGFKWIGNQGITMDNDGYVFLFGYEVEIGFCCGNISYDKDGIRAATIFHEMAIQLYENNETCYSKLQKLRAKYGYFEMLTGYERMTDELVTTKMARLRSGFDKTYPKKMGKYEIVRVRDMTTGYDSGEKNKKSVLPQQSNSEMITFWFKNGATATIRNSGTEPKLKYYLETYDKNDEKIALKLKDDMGKVLLQEFMQVDVKK